MRRVGDGVISKYGSPFTVPLPRMNSEMGRLSSNVISRSALKCRSRLTRDRKVWISSAVLIKSTKVIAI